MKRKNSNKNDLKEFKIITDKISEEEVVVHDEEEETDTDNNIDEDEDEYDTTVECDE